MFAKKNKYSIIALICIVLTLIFSIVTFCGTFFVYSMFPAILSAMASLILAIIGGVKNRNVFSIIVLVVSVVVLLCTALFFEMLFEFLFILD